MSHDHHHHHTGNTRILSYALLITLAYALIEAIGGWIFQSLALLGDSGHMTSDAFALGMALLAAWISQKPPSASHSYGLGRIEVLTAILNGTVMLFIVVSIAVAAVNRLLNPVPVSGLGVLLVASIGLVINIVVFTLLSSKHDNINIRGALLHVMGDLLGSLAAILSGAVIHFTHWTPIDPILSLFICALILFSSLQLIATALRIIMEAVPKHLDFNQIGMQMAAIDGVRSVHDLHIWTMPSGGIALSAHLILDKLEDWATIQVQLEKRLQEEFGIHHTTLQPELVKTEPLSHISEIQQENRE